MPPEPGVRGRRADGRSDRFRSEVCPTQSTSNIPSANPVKTSNPLPKRLPQPVYPSNFVSWRNDGRCSTGRAAPGKKPRDRAQIVEGNCAQDAQPSRGRSANYLQFRSGTANDLVTKTGRDCFPKVCSTELLLAGSCSPQRQPRLPEHWQHACPLCGSLAVALIITLVAAQWLTSGKPVID